MALWGPVRPVFGRPLVGRLFVQCSWRCHEVLGDVPFISFSGSEGKVGVLAPNLIAHSARGSSATHGRMLRAWLLPLAHNPSFSGLWGSLEEAKKTPEAPNGICTGDGF